MKKPKKVTKLPKEPGVYVAAKDLLAWKGFKCGIWMSSRGLVARVKIPKGATIVVPRDDEQSKFRVDSFFLPGRGTVYSPVQRYEYERGKLYARKRINRSLKEECGTGFHMCWTKSQAKYWAEF